MPATLLQRALDTAPERAPAHLREADHEFFCFRAGGLSLGVSSSGVREVFTGYTWTPLPRAPAFLLGLIGHRGEVFPVLDVVRFLEKGETRIGPRARLFIATADHHVCAVVAEELAGLTRIPLAQIQSAPLSGRGPGEDMWMGVGGAPPGWNLIHLDKLLASAHERVVRR